MIMFLGRLMQLLSFKNSLRRWTLLVFAVDEEKRCADPTLLCLNTNGYRLGTHHPWLWQNAICPFSLISPRYSVADSRFFGGVNSSGTILPPTEDWLLGTENLQGWCLSRFHGVVKFWPQLLHNVLDNGAVGVTVAGTGEADGEGDKVSGDDALESQSSESWNKVLLTSLESDFPDVGVLKDGVNDDEVTPGISLSQTDLPSTIFILWQSLSWRTLLLFWVSFLLQTRQWRMSRPRSSCDWTMKELLPDS